MLPNLTNSVRTHFFSIITAIIIAVVAAGYVLLILPRQTAQEDVKNKAIFNSIKKQLGDYIDDRVKAIDTIGVTPDPDEKGKFIFSEKSSIQYYVDSIYTAEAYVHHNTLKIKRNIDIKEIGKKTNKAL